MADACVHALLPKWSRHRSVLRYARHKSSALTRWPGRSLHRTIATTRTESPPDTCTGSAVKIARSESSSSPI